MSNPESLRRLIDAYRYKVIAGEKGIDPETMVRERCRHCQKCRGKGCPEVMRELPAFENWISIDSYLSVFMNDLAKLAAKGIAPDMNRSRELAVAHGMDESILDECVNAAAESAFRIFRLIPVAIEECKAFHSNPKTATPARDELLLDVYRWLRPKISAQLASNEGTLKGNVPTASVLDAWTVQFLERFDQFNTEFRVQKVAAGDETKNVEIPIPSDQLVGNFLNYVSAHAQYAKLKKRKLTKRHSVPSIHTENGDVEIADDTSSPAELERAQQFMFEINGLHAAIARLPELNRKAIEMKLDGCKGAEIAARLGLTEGQVKNVIRSTKKMLREWMPSDDE